MVSKNSFPKEMYIAMHQAKKLETINKTKYWAVLKIIFTNLIKNPSTNPFYQKHKLNDNNTHLIFTVIMQKLR